MGLVLDTTFNVICNWSGRNGLSQRHPERSENCVTSIVIKKYFPLNFTRKENFMTINMSKIILCSHCNEKINLLSHTNDQNNLL
jgi:hypothetical protein